MSIYRRAFHYYRPFLWQTITGLVLSLCGIGLNLLKPWPFKIIVDDVLPSAAKGDSVSAQLVRYFGNASPRQSFSCSVC